MVVPRAICVLLFITLASASSVWAVEADAEWPATLLEHTAIAQQAWAPTPRNRLEKLQLTQTPRIPEYLGAKNNQVLFFGDDARGGATDTAGNQHENDGRAREPQSDHFDENHGQAGEQATSFAGLPLPAPRAPRQACGKKTGCVKDTDGPKKPEPLVVPPPVTPPPPPSPLIVPPPNKADYPNPPPPENPLPSPPTPTCAGLCNPDAKDPLLANVANPPLDDLSVAAVGAERNVLQKIMEKLRNREGWLRAQKNWLSKAVEAAATVRREIELAEFTKDAVASDLEQLKIAQDNLNIKYKADRLKWSFKDRKITLEALKARLEELEHAKADVAHQIRSAKDEVTILESTLGPPSQQVQISPEELEDPLKFLEDVAVPEEY